MPCRLNSRAVCSVRSCEIRLPKRPVLFATIPFQHGNVRSRCAADAAMSLRMLNRRTAIQSLGAIAATFALPSQVTASAPSSPRKPPRLRPGDKVGLIEPAGFTNDAFDLRSEEHTSELQSLMRISYAVFCLKK